MKLVFIDGFAPSAGDTYEFLVANASEGLEFQEVAVLGLAPGWEFEMGENEQGEPVLLSLSDGVAMQNTHPLQALPRTLKLSALDQ